MPRPRASRPKGAPAARRPRGRPTLLTPKLATEITKRLAAGATYEETAVSLGVGRATVQTWLRIGREAEEKDERGEPLTDRERECLGFVQAAEKARADLEVRLLTAAQRDALTDGRIAIALLERLWPERYAPRSRGVRERPAGGRPVGSASAPDRAARPGRLYAVEGGGG